MTHSKEKKRALKRIQQYQKQFGLEEPFEILMDGTFLYQALVRKLVLKELVQGIFGKYPLKWLVTNCIRKELKSLGESHRGATLLAKRLQVLPCCHENQQETDASSCIQSIVHNRKLFVATCDRELIRFCRGSTPVMYITNRDTLYLEKPTKSKSTVVETSS